MYSIAKILCLDYKEYLRIYTEGRLNYCILTYMKISLIKYSFKSCFTGVDLI